MKKVAILQSDYIPWKGYFDIIGMVDEFILYDDMQYTKRDWRNRNRIRTADGTKWITIPVETKGQFFQRIRDTRIADRSWAASHLKSLSLNYGRAPHFREIMDLLAPLYEKAGEMEFLSDVNRLFLEAVCGYLGIGTKITWSSDYTLQDGKTERLAGLVRDAGGSLYLSGPAAKDYIEDRVFEEAEIELRYMSYEGYPPYPQLFGEFDPYVSVVDLLFMTGKDAPSYMLFPGSTL